MPANKKLRLKTGNWTKSQYFNLLINLTFLTIQIGPTWLIRLKMYFKEKEFKEANLFFIYVSLLHFKPLFSIQVSCIRFLSKCPILLFIRKFRKVCLFKGWIPPLPHGSNPYLLSWMVWTHFHPTVACTSSTIIVMY